MNKITLLRNFKESFNRYDRFGSVMEWWFTVAFILYQKYGSHSIPESWKYTPNNDIGSLYDVEIEEYGLISQYDLFSFDRESLVSFGDVLEKFYELLNKKGETY